MTDISTPAMPDSVSNPIIVRPAVPSFSRAFVMWWSFKGWRNILGVVIATALLSWVLNATGQARGALVVAAVVFPLACTALILQNLYLAWRMLKGLDESPPEFVIDEKSIAVRIVGTRALPLMLPFPRRAKCTRWGYLLWLPEDDILFLRRDDFPSATDTARFEQMLVEKRLLRDKSKQHPERG